MKKLLITLALAILAVSVSAQEYKPATWGVRAGANFMAFSGYQANNDYSFPPLVGVYAGAYAEWNNVFSNFGIRAELDYAAQGNKMKGKVIDYTLNNRGHYLNIPVMLEYAFLENRLRVMAGPQLGICLGGGSTLKAGGVTTKEAWAKSDYNTFDFSLVFGVEYMFIDQLGVELRYDLGITSAIAASVESTCRANRGFQLGLVYKF